MTKSNKFSPEAQAAAFASALGESASCFLATQDDCSIIKSELADISSDLKLMRWMLAATVAGVIFLVAKAFF